MLCVCYMALCWHVVPALVISSHPSCPLYSMSACFIHAPTHPDNQPSTQHLLFSTYYSLVRRYKQEQYLRFFLMFLFFYMILSCKKAHSLCVLPCPQIFISMAKDLFLSHTCMYSASFVPSSSCRFHNYPIFLSFLLSFLLTVVCRPCWVIEGA